MASEEFLKKKV